MKRLFIALLLMISLTITSQEEKGVWVDGLLQDLLTEYIVEAGDRGHDIIACVVDMDVIGFSTNVKFPVLGVATDDHKTVYINPYCALDVSVLKSVFFHEMTHSVFGVKHSECSEFDIMKASAPKSFRVYDDPEFWEERLDELFYGKTVRDF